MAWESGHCQKSHDSISPSASLQEVGLHNSNLFLFSFEEEGIPSSPIILSKKRALHTRLLEFERSHDEFGMIEKTDESRKGVQYGTCT